MRSWCFAKSITIVLFVAIVTTKMWPKRRFGSSSKLGFGALSILDTAVPFEKELCTAVPQVRSDSWRRIVRPVVSGGLLNRIVHVLPSSSLFNTRPSRGRYLWMLISSLSKLWNTVLARLPSTMQSSARRTSWRCFRATVGRAPHFQMNTKSGRIST